MMDNGSARSYVSERLVDELGAERWGKQNLRIGKVFSKESKEHTFSSTTIQVKLGDGTWRQEDFLVAPCITTEFIHQSLPQKLRDKFFQEEPIQRSRSRLPDDVWRNRPAAPQSEAPVSVSLDILIGMDKYHYFDRNHHNPTQLQKNLKVLHTEFGWMPTGTLKSEPSPQQKPGNREVDPVCVVQPTLLVNQMVQPNHLVNQIVNKEEVVDQDDCFKREQRRS